MQVSEGFWVQSPTSAHPVDTLEQDVPNMRVGPFWATEQKHGGRPCKQKFYGNERNED